jgi:phospho-N-acetylmuramoyl-pentapeptide-transferase
MLYHLLFPLRTHIFAFNVFRYITFRSAYAAMTALVMSLLLGPWVIRKLRSRRIGAMVREEGPAPHVSKRGTPTMGGLLILPSIVIPTLLWADLTVPQVWYAVGVTVWLGVVGLIDDYLKTTNGNSKGMHARYKFVGQLVLGIGLGLALMLNPVKPGYGTVTSLMFVKNTFLHLGLFYVPFVAAVIVGTSNATNLADGLDGLAIGLITICVAAYAVLSYVVGHAKISDYLDILFIRGSGELTVFCASIAGASLGFLWFNAHPAEMFMGDTGSLALGGAIGACAVLIKQEILLLIVGGVFVIEAVSVIIQVVYFKVTGGRRVFRMAPLHHHFEMVGWAESKIVTRFWIVGVIFAVLALSTLKIR